MTLRDLISEIIGRAKANGGDPLLLAAADAMDKLSTDLADADCQEGECCRHCIHARELDRIARCEEADYMCISCPEPCRCKECRGQNWEWIRTCGLTEDDDV